MTEQASDRGAGLASRKLLNVLGLTFGVSITVGGAIGVGILRQPGAVAQSLPRPEWILLAWLVAGLYLLLGAFSVAELAAMTQRSGGYYVYVRSAMGPFAGFFTGWAHWINLCGGAAYVSMTLAGYITQLLPTLGGAERWVAIFVITSLAALQWPGVRGAGRVQDWMTLIKGVSFMALVVALVLFADQKKPESAEGPFPRGWGLLAACVLAFQAILQAYDGWEGVIYFGEEMRQPESTMPRSLILGTLILIVIYVSVNLALLQVMPISAIAGSDLALGKATEQVFGAWGATIFTLFAVISILVSSNAGTLQVPRVLYAMSCDRLFFAWGARVNAGGTPTVALATTTLAIVLAISVTGQTLDRLLSVIAFFMVTNYSLLFIALFVLRLRKPQAPRPYLAWGYPWTTAIALLGSFVYLGAAIYQDRENSLYSLGLLLLSYPIFLAVRSSSKRGENLAESGRPPLATSGPLDR